jgi:DNA end-binding protein Ku
MAARSIATLTLSFGLVSIPVKLYSATESSATVRFNLLAKDGSRVKQQYVSEKDGKVVERAEMVKGYEFEKDRYVIFTPEELKALETSPTHMVEIVAFVPLATVDPIYYDKAYLLAPDKRGGKPYALLAEAMRQSGRCALAQWASKGKQYVVQIRPAEDGLVLQQLLYADEVRSLKDLDIEDVAVSQAELQLAMQLIEQNAQDAYQPDLFQDHERERVLAAIDKKIAGQQIVAVEPVEAPTSGQVIDLMDALRASLAGKGGGAAKPAGKAAPAADKAPARAAAKAADKPADKAADKAKPAKEGNGAEVVSVNALKDRKPARRAPAPAPEAEEPTAAPARARARR